MSDTMNINTNYHSECCNDNCDIPLPDSLYQYISLDTENVLKCKLDINKFQSGIEKMSKIAGMITALTNVGVPPCDALEFIGAMRSNKIASDIQTAINEQTNDANIEIARITGEANMKQMF